MSHFYGTIHVQEDSAHTGIPRYSFASESGLVVNLRSPEGSVFIRVYEGEAADGGLEDRVRIMLQGFELYDGPLSECAFESIRTNTQEVENG